MLLGVRAIIDWFAWCSVLTPTWERGFSGLVNTRIRIGVSQVRVGVSQIRVGVSHDSGWC